MDTKNVMFSGGIPADGPEAVFRLLADTIGDRAISWPDGETNAERRGWVGGIIKEVFPRVPGLEPVPSSAANTDSEGYQAMSAFQIVPGVTVDFRGLLPYAHDAIESYEIFNRLKVEGVVPADTRFQVAVPGAHDPISLAVPNAQDWPVVFAAWEQAVADEHRKILEVIPADELTIQIDYCTELDHIGGAWAKLLPWVPDRPAEELFAEYTGADYILPHLEGIPAGVRVGFHICCGTAPSYPVQPLDDLALPVRLANAIQATTGERVDYFHLPVMTDSSDAYFAPLAQLETGHADIYLGLEVNDGLEAMERRIESARKFLPEFGVAHYCGYFWNKEIMRGLLETLARGADSAAA